MSSFPPSRSPSLRLPFSLSLRSSSTSLNHLLCHKRSHHAQKYDGQPGHRGYAVEWCSIAVGETEWERERKTQIRMDGEMREEHKWKKKKARNRINLSSSTPVAKALRAKQVRLRPVLKVPSARILTRTFSKLRVYHIMVQWYTTSLNNVCVYMLMLSVRILHLHHPAALWWMELTLLWFLPEDGLSCTGRNLIMHEYCGKLIMHNYKTAVIQSNDFFCFDGRNFATIYQDSLRVSGGRGRKTHGGLNLLLSAPLEKSSNLSFNQTGEHLHL